MERLKKGLVKERSSVSSNSVVANWRMDGQTLIKTMERPIYNPLSTWIESRIFFFLPVLVNHSLTKGHSYPAPDLTI